MSVTPNADIDFELYKVFYYVAKNLSFSAASDLLYISQSAVSQSVKNLETKMECRLFVRNTKQVKLTQEGEILFKYIEQAYNIIKLGERSLNEVRALERGEVRIGATDTICKYYLLPVFKNFSELYPQIKIHVVNRTSPECINMLQKGTVDVVVVNIPPTLADKDLDIQPLKNIQDIFIAGNNFSHLKDRALDFAELKDYPLLLLERNTTTRNSIEALMAEHGVTLNPEIELSSVDLLVEMAKIGLGISFVVKDYVEKALKAGEVIIIKTRQQVPARRLGVITNRKIPMPLAAQKFVELLSL